MASSLQSSCMVLSSSSSSTPNPRNNISQLRKPSTLLTNPSRSRRFHVSCSSGSDSDGSIDRRNMLLGLGGLYGAANLISDPKAAYGAGPIQPPDLTKCGAATPRPGEDPLDFSCCPPVTDDIKDYKLPLVKKMRVRPPAHTLSPQYIAKYEEAIRRMRALDKTDPNDPRGFTQQANIHCAYCNGAYDQVGFGTTDLSIHFSWLFFPFHRWYLYFYERILGSLISDPTFALPYWNWDNPPGMKLPAIFNNERSPLYDVNRNPKHRTPQILDLSLNFNLDEDEKKVINSNLNIISTELRRVDTFEDFMGKAYRAGDIATPGGGTVENGSHTAIHRWTGNPANQYNEDLGNFYSAGRDPAFYSHHANVDRMWTIWQDLKTKVPKTSNDPDYLNTEFLFYDEKKQLVRVKVADSVDNERMGFVYQKENTPWLFYVPPKKASRVSIKDITKGAKTADKLFPLSLDGIIRVLVPKTTKGKAEEVLVLEDIETNPRQFIKFDVYINDDDDSPGDVDRAEYVGSFSQLPHKVHFKQGKGTLRFSLKDVYEDIQTDENDDSVVVTIVPRTNGKYVTIGGIRIIKSELQNTV